MTHNKKHIGFYDIMDAVVKKLVTASRIVIDMGDGLACKTLARQRNIEINFLPIPDELPRDDLKSYKYYASQLLQGKVRVLGYDICFKDAPNWSKDYKSGFEWQKGKFYKKYIQVNLNNEADVKMPRELSRFHFGLFLGIAYRFIGDKQYYMCFRNLVLNWIENNPFMHSINWGCTQDIAIRAVNWIWAASLFHNEILKDRAFYNMLAKSLYQHGVFIYLHPEKGAFNNHNHYIGDLVGQIYLGVVFKNTRMGFEWLKHGKIELFREMRYQILPSGPSYERSTNYHRFVTEMFLSAIVLLDRGSHEIPSDIWFRLEKMLEFTLYYTKPDGLAPIIGDQDDARLHPFSLQSNLDHSDLLALGAVLYRRSDFKEATHRFPIDGYLLLGWDAEKVFNNIEVNYHTISSRAFPDAGFYVIRSDRDYMFINNSGKSKNAELGGGTHTHSDLLSFELYIDDKTFLVDPGSYVYSSDPDERMRFRSTAMHNTIVIDKKNQNTLSRESLWDFPRDASPTTLIWKDDDKVVQFEGKHDGYKKLVEPIVHHRKIEYNKEERTWVITDMLIGSGAHYVELFLHFDIGIDIMYSDNLLSTQCEKGTNIDIQFNAEKRLNGSIQNGWVSKSYSRRERAKVFCLHGEFEGPLKIVTVINRRCNETSI